jgi:glycosyltransferase involved in cell wall biosynthesis
MVDNYLILLSTFNGEKYLGELLESLVKQENVKCVVIVRDDGSTDRTLQILDSFKAALHVEIHVGENIGPDASFKYLMNLAQNRKFDFVAFCDQDDLWLTDKLSRAASKLKESGKSCYSSKRLCFSNFNKGTTLFPKNDPEISSKKMIFENVSPGCTIVLSREHFQRLLKLGCTEIDGNYDHIIQVMSVLIGEVFFDTESRIYYRLHDVNSIGIMGLRDRRFAKTIQQIRIKLKTLVEIRARMTLEMSEEDLALMEKILYKRKFVFSGFWTFKLPKMRNKRIDDFALKIFLLFIRV